MLHCYPLGCLRNRQSDPPSINRGTPKQWRFLLERNNGVSLSPYLVPLRRRCLLKTSLLNQQKFLQNEGISILGNMSVELFKKRNDGLGNLSGKSPLEKQKWREGYLRASERVEQKTSVLVEHCTYYSTVWDNADGQRLLVEMSKNK